MKDFIQCVCNSKDCGYEFITNSCEKMECPSCGNDTVSTTMVKAIVLSDCDYDDLESSKDLQNKIETNVQKLKQAIKASIGIANLIKNFCKENNLDMPTKVTFSFDRHFDFDENGDDYLSSVVFDNSSLNDSLHDKLLDELKINYTVDELKANDSIRL